MEKKLSYSVAIRTMGTAGEKYNKLLQSIEKQTIQPEKVIIVLPIGCKQPFTYLGCEKFIYAPKGMISQRMAAIEYTESDFILFCDDDIEFPEKFVEILLNDSKATGADCLAGPLLSFFPPRNLKYFISSCLGGACVMIHGRKEKYVRLLKSGGWSYNWSIETGEHKIYETDSFPWTCFLIRRKSLINICFDDELWAEKHGYAAFDDQIFSAKLKINGYKSCIVSNAEYVHNDAKTSTRGTNLLPVFARAYNKYVYWHRFIFRLSNNNIEKLFAVVCFYYSYIVSVMYDMILVCLKKKHIEVVKSTIKGHKEAGKFIKSEEYRKLRSPVVSRGNKGEK